MRKYFPETVALIGTLALIAASFCEATELETLSPWRQGYLDIHHISVAADSTLIVYPDGTSMLFDAGGSDKEDFEKRASPLRAASVRPNNSRQPGEWYAEYIKNTLRKAGLPNQLDYAVISHFDTDHYGLLQETAPKSTQGAFELTGITAVNELVPIDTLIDRAYPDYSYPVELRHYRRNNPTFLNYLEFVSNRLLNNRRTQVLSVGSTTQLGLRHDPDKFQGFVVRNIKSNGVIYDPVSKNGIQTLFSSGEVLNSQGRFVENPLSIAILVSYGPFDYFTGGDMTGLGDGTVPDWFDTETPVAAVVGEVDVLALNHHGVRDATNLTFALTLKPQVSVVHGRTSDHPGQEVVHRLGQIDQPHSFPSLFGTFIHAETKVVYGPPMSRLLAPEHGHIVIRVYPPGETFDLFILDDHSVKRKVLARYGPFISQE